jgi:SET domain-containing protein
MVRNIRLRGKVNDAWAQPQLQVRRSRIAGRGVFAGAPIERGQRIVEYKGRLLTKKQFDRSRSNYLFEISRTMTIDGWIPGNVARFINHSCRPNCEAYNWRGRIYIKARRGIKAGEELSYDYGPDYFSQEIKPRGCRCNKCSE